MFYDQILLPFMIIFRDIVLWENYPIFVKCVEEPLPTYGWDYVVKIHLFDVLGQAFEISGG